LEAAGGGFDLILFGNESADSGGYQVGIRVARALGRPVVSGIKAMEVAGSTVSARRPTDAGSEVYLLELPAVVAVKEGINLPRYPTLPGRLKSKKAAMINWAPEHRPGGMQMLGLMNPPEQISETIILGTGVEAAPKVVDLLDELGLL
jgi:electron transfer flavoprotein beta subunit